MLICLFADRLFTAGEDWLLFERVMTSDAMGPERPPTHFPASGTRGVATGVDIGIYTPPPKKKKSAQVNFLWGKNDVRTAIQQFYTPKKLIPPKQIYGYAPERDASPILFGN